METVLFSQLELMPEIERAIKAMGFESATPIQAQSIPAVRSGRDVIGRSQTGTGKTVAFAVPAIERIDLQESKTTIQVLILCPTRELAQQATEEIRKLARFVPDIRPVAIYGGAPISKQCIDLRKANIVVGTPGRVMDHMRRKSIKLNNLKMIILDEADEMLNMGFKEDIETILTDTPEDRQTVLFSATMPPAIMKITKQFQKDPILVEIDKSQVTLENIEQSYIDVPHSHKTAALLSLLQFHKPQRAIIFCSTKKMADELTVTLNDNNISAKSIHSDIKQSQRTTTMNDFKKGKISLLVATDIAARGIDVNDIDYVINFDIPSNTEYYVHRIGRTGRAGKAGQSITICGTRREVAELMNIARFVKSTIKPLELPTSDVMLEQSINDIAKSIQAKAEDVKPVYGKILDKLVEEGYSLELITQSLLALMYPDIDKKIEKIPALSHKSKPQEQKGDRPFKKRRPDAHRGYGNRRTSDRATKEPFIDTHSSKQAKKKNK